MKKTIAIMVGAIGLIVFGLFPYGAANADAGRDYHSSEFSSGYEFRKADYRDGYFDFHSHDRHNQWFGHNPRHDHKFKPFGNKIRKHFKHHPKVKHVRRDFHHKHNHFYSHRHRSFIPYLSYDRGHYGYDDGKYRRWR